MLRLSCILLAILITNGCKETTFGSACTKGPIVIKQSLYKKSSPYVIDPVLMLKNNGYDIILDRDDTFALLAERSNTSEISAEAISSIHLRLEKLPKDEAPYNVERIKLDLNKLSGEDLQKEVMIHFELKVLYLNALRDGLAKINSEEKPINTEIQSYWAFVEGGKISGVRVLEGKNILYDYCTLTPIGSIKP